MTVVAVVRDISHHNAIPDYDRLRAVNDAFQIKITESTTFVDSLAWSGAGPGAHYRGCAGKPRAPYHFARPVSIPGQIAHFLKWKARIGRWERPDMLDCEFEGITGAFVRALVAEYRRQSGIRSVQVYLGLHDLLTSCPPATFWDQDIALQAARYRKIGAPLNTAQWGSHLGFDHPGLTTYQWDNATPFYPGGPVGDISYDRVSVGPRPQEDDMFDDTDRARLATVFQQMVGPAADGGIPNVGQFTGWPAVTFTEDHVARGLTAVDLLRYNRQRFNAQETRLTTIEERLDALAVGDVDYQRLATAVADEMDRRARDNNPATGSPS